MSRSTLLGGSLRNLFFCISFLCAAVGISAAQDNTTTVLSAPVSATLGKQATLTATVSDTPTPATPPVGAVSFFDGGVLIGSAALNGVAPGVATFNTSVLSVGSHGITATFVPANPLTFNSSNSGAAQQQVITPRPTKTALPATGTITVGSPLSVAATVTDLDPGTGVAVPGAGTFASLTNPRSEVRSGHASALLPNGNVLIVGGTD